MDYDVRLIDRFQFIVECRDEVDAQAECMAWNMEYLQTANVDEIVRTVVMAGGAFGDIVFAPRSLLIESVCWEAPNTFIEVIVGYAGCHDWTPCRTMVEGVDGWFEFDIFRTVEYAPFIPDNEWYRLPKPEWQVVPYPPPLAVASAPPHYREEPKP